CLSVSAGCGQGGTKLDLPHWCLTPSRRRCAVMSHSDYWQEPAAKNAHRRQECRLRQEERLARSRADCERRLAELSQRQEVLHARREQRKRVHEARMRAWRANAQRERRELRARLTLTHLATRRRGLASEQTLFMSVCNLSYSAGRALGQRAKANPPVVE